MPELSNTLLSSRYANRNTRGYEIFRAPYDILCTNANANFQAPLRYAKIQKGFDLPRKEEARFINPVVYLVHIHLTYNFLNLLAISLIQGFTFFKIR